MSTPETPPQEKPQEQQKRVEVRFPLIIIRTKRFAKVFDRLGAMRSSHYISWILLATVPFVAGVALFLMLTSLIGILSNPIVGQVARELGPGSVLLLPGINPMLPIIYGWIAIVVAIVVHEGAHGVIARNVGFNVKSSGLLFFLFIPIGAFVDVDEEQIKTARARPSLKVMAAGVGSNLLVGAVCLISLFLIVGSLSPAVSGVYVTEATADMPAQAAGLMAKDVFVSIDGVPVSNTTALRTILDTKTTGDTVNVTVMRGEGWQTTYTTTITLTTDGNRTVMGVRTYDLYTQERLDGYRNFTLDRLTLYMVPPTLGETIVPYSDFLSGFYTSPLGPYWAVAANTLFWIWFINFNLAIFNALPLYPLDGGRIFDITIKRYLGKRLSEKAIRTITLTATFLCVMLVLSVIVLPFLL